MFDITQVYSYMADETNQDIKANEVIRQLEELRITKREFEEDCNLRYAELFQRLSVFRRLNIPIENGFQTGFINDRLSSSSDGTTETSQETVDQDIIR